MPAALKAEEAALDAQKVRAAFEAHMRDSVAEVVCRIMTRGWREVHGEVAAKSGRCQHVD
jgi:hypothetical protein